MTNEERDLIARFIARVGGQPQAAGSFGASVPATQTALPPIDPEADRFIGATMNQFPEARYRITQMAVVQEAAMAEAQNRIRRLEWELQQAQMQAQQQSSRGGGGSFFGNLFGGGNRQAPPQQSYGQQGYGQQAYGQQGRPGYQSAPPPPQPNYAPGMQSGMFQRQGSGFLGSALTTAAGVAGGLVAGEALMNLFDGGRGGGLGGGLGGGEMGGGNFGDSGGAWGGGGDPFAGQGTDVDPSFGSDSGGFDDGGGFDSGGGFDDSSSF